MATRSTISKLNADGTITSIYCHWDGYLSNNGAILLQHYNDEEKIDKLLSLGSLSSLNENVEPKTENHSFETPEENVCVAYHRDRGEDLSITKFISESEYNLMKSHKQEYNYLWKDGKWYLNMDDRDGETVLTSEMCGE